MNTLIQLRRTESAEQLMHQADTLLSDLDSVEVNAEFLHRCWLTVNGFAQEIADQIGQDPIQHPFAPGVSYQVQRGTLIRDDSNDRVAFHYDRSWFGTRTYKDETVIGLDSKHLRKLL